LCNRSAVVDLTPYWLQYQVYNSILRQWPKDFYEVLKSHDNLFTTTIHVLVSAVQKIARVMKLPEGLLLYRGLGCTELPGHFWKAAATGCRGFAEWGFMSTTSDKSIAIQYSGVKEGKPLAMLFEIQVSSVDRGACIQEFSQYPKEEEYLWVPCSFVEPHGPEYVEVTSFGVIRVVRVRINANLKASTVESMLLAKKQAHLASFKYLLDEIKDELSKRAIKGDAERRLKRDLTMRHPHNQELHTVDTFLSQILRQCREVFETHKKKDPSAYNSSESFRWIVVEMLEVRVMAVSKLELWLRDDSRLIEHDHPLELREAHRKRIVFLERRMPGAIGRSSMEREARTLCIVKGLLQRSVDETNDLGEVRIISAAAEGASCQDLRLLIRAGADVDAVTRKGDTALIMAAAAGNVDVVEALAVARADVNHVGWRGETAMIVAAQAGHVECVRTLGRLKADLSAVDDKKVSAMFIAAQKGHAECLRAMVELGADPHALNEKDQTMLLIAAYCGSVDCVRFLIQVRFSMAAACECLPTFSCDNVNC
jgi:ankyrin repeat protein